MAKADWYGRWSWRTGLWCVGAVLWPLIATPAARADRLEFSAVAKITSTIPSKGWDVWQNQPVDFSCNWSAKVGHGSWKSDGSAAAVSAYALRVQHFDSWKPNQDNLQSLEHALGVNGVDTRILAVKTGIVPAGTHATGKAFAGVWKMSFKPDAPGNWVVGCYATAPKAYKVYEIDKPCNGSTYAWCAVGWNSLYVSKPLPFEVGEIPEPEILSPVKAPGDELLVLSADVIGVSLSARIPNVSVTREKTKATYAPCGVLLHESGYTEDALPCPPMYFWVWASDYTAAFAERWHLQLLKRQNNGAFKQIQTFSGLVSQQTFERIVPPSLFDIDKDAGGIWRLKAWLTQENTPDGLVAGKASVVDFEVQLKPKSMPTVVQPSTFPPVMQPGRSVRQSTSPSVMQPLQRVKQLRGQTGTIDAEGEFLVDSGRAAASAGSVVAQPMSGFGQGWSGNAQLFWHGASGGATLDLTVDVTAEGVYAVELYATKAPDYGDVTLSANSQASGTVIGGYAPGVAAPTPINVGNFNFKAGANTVRLTVVGKAPQSSGYFMGIDRIRLRPVGR